MAKVSVREFKSRLSYYLELAQKETVSVTNWGKIVANVVTPQDNPINELNLLKDYMKELEERLVNKQENVVTPSEEWKPLNTNKCEWPGCKEVGTVDWDDDVYDYDNGSKRIKGKFCEFHIKHLKAEKEKI